MKVLGNNKISISKEDLKNAILHTAGDEVIFTLPEGYHIASYSSNEVVTSRIKQLAEKITDLVIHDEKLQYAHNSISPDHLRDILTFWLAREKADNYSRKEIIGMKYMIVDGFNALHLPENTMIDISHHFDYTELCIVLYGLFSHKTARGICNAIHNKHLLCERKFAIEHFRISLLMEIRNKLAFRHL